MQTSFNFYLNNNLIPPPDNWSELEGDLSTKPEMLAKMKSLHAHQNKRAERANQIVERCKKQYAGTEVIEVPMTYSEDGFEILRASASTLHH